MLHRMNQRRLNPERRRNVLNLLRLSTQTVLSPYHFSYVFEETFEITPQQWVQQRGLDASAVALQHGKGRSIDDTAKGLGFSSQARMT